jgi:hypothetical protein
MKPIEAGFNGEVGINLNIPSMIDGGIYKLRRGSTPPWMTDVNYKNQLMWQQSTPPKLLYCNSNNQWFELDFIPINL